MALIPRLVCGRYRRLVAALPLFLSLLAPAAAAANSGFTPQARVGFTVGDQWEPAIAADNSGHVYILYPQYGRLPGCLRCPLPSMILVVSNDNGATWQPSREIAPHDSAEFDAQIAVDPVDQRTVYAAWLQNNKRDTVVAKSADFGQSWSMVVVDRSNTESDKPVLAVRGQDVHVGFSRARKIWVASSHDGGLTFNSTAVTPTSLFAGALAGAATITPKGGVFVSWTGYQDNNEIRGRANLYISESSDGGSTWKSTLMDFSGAPPDCAASHCDWDFLGAQITVASDAAGNLYALWNSSTADKGPERIYFSASFNGGTKWAAKAEVSEAPAGTEHAFPALAAGDDGDIRIAWMDSRNHPFWNTYYRSSNDSGSTWHAENKISGFARGYKYVHQDGFNFPFGDYFQMTIDGNGQSHLVWGEGQNFQTPGSIWYSNGH